jgi:hypothetical protein
LATRHCTGRAWQYDPIWAVLDELAAGAAPAAYTHELREFRLPRSWLPAREQRWFWAADENTVRVWSADGYVVFACPRGPEPALRQVIREAELYDRPVQIETAAAAPPDWPADWLSLILPYIEVRLAESLELPVPDAVLLVLQQRGNLYVSSSHIDLVLDLDCVSLPLRRSGLDANPGWQPEFARIVSFHFR